MSKEMTNRWMYFLGALILSFALVWFGFAFLSISSETFSSLELLLFGLLTVIGGICLLTLLDIKKSWLGGLLVTAVGFYGCARAAGIIQQPWLARLAGVVCWAAAAVILYMAWPTRKHSKGQPHGTSPTAR